jgi:leucyl aminopeptidase
LKIEISVVQADWAKHATPLLAVNLFEGAADLVGPVRGIDLAMSGQISRLVGRGDFKAREGQTHVLYPQDGTLPIERVLLVGLGKRDKLGLEQLRRAAATAVKQAVRLGVDRLSTIMHDLEFVSDRISAEDAARAIAEGVHLGGYVFDELKSKDREEQETGKLARVEILEMVAEKLGAIESGTRLGTILANGENLARRLGNLPGNIATPGYLADQARELATRRGMSVTILGRSELESQGMGALLAVAQGSEQEPYLIVLEHRKDPGGGKPLVLVGKGLTFDSGGISIKPALGMEEMKFDMCGAAAVLGAMDAIGALEVPLDVIGIVPTSENLLSGRAMKPGDIVRSHLGKTIEIVNTDAEGRLILADALSYARRFEPAAIVDMATLTGSCVIALGNQASAIMGNDESLIAEIREAGERVHERVWPLPMYDEYREQIKSDYADIKNSGGRPAGTITAGWFLREFVGEVPWVHLDIAGTANGDGKLAYQVKGATGVPTRLLVEWVLSRAG